MLAETEDPSCSVSGMHKMRHHIFVGKIESFFVPTTECLCSTDMTFLWKGLTILRFRDSALVLHEQKMSVKKVWIVSSLPTERWCFTDIVYWIGSMISKKCAGTLDILHVCRRI